MEGLAIGCLLGVFTYIITRVVAIMLGDFNSAILILPLSATTGTIVFMGYAVTKVRSRMAIKKQ